MNRQTIFDYVIKRYKTKPDYPWNDENAVLRHSDNNKWYGLVMTVGFDKLGINAEGMVDVLNIKCDPVLIGSLRMEEGFHAAYHMNKDKWITIRLDGSVPMEQIQNLIDMSYDLTASKSKFRKTDK